jgi:hypothetical protein
LCDVLVTDKLQPDYKNVFKATTRFSYILRDELRLSNKPGKMKQGFDEKKLAEIRRKQGHKCFFESPRDFRKQVRDKK